MVSIKPLLASFAAAILLVAGCDRAPTAGDVRGTVTLDGKPLEDAIRFSPVEGHVNTAGGLIKNGQFTSAVPVAKHRVEISSTQVQGGTPANRHSDANYTVIQLIPEKYNTNSELTWDVKSGLNEPHFELKSR